MAEAFHPCYMFQQSCIKYRKLWAQLFTSVILSGLNKHSNDPKGMKWTCWGVIISWARKNVGIIILLLLLVWDKVFLYSPDWLWSCDIPSSASWTQELWVCTIILGKRWNSYQDGIGNSIGASWYWKEKGIDVLLSKSKERLMSTTNEALCKAIRPWLDLQNRQVLVNGFIWFSVYQDGLGTFVTLRRQFFGKLLT